MLDATMATPRKTKKTPKKAPAKAAPDPQSFAEIGRTAAREAQRKALLAAAKANDWNLTAIAAALRMGDGSAVIRAFKALAPEEYQSAKDTGKITQGRRFDA